MLATQTAVGAERVASLYREWREGKLKARAATPLDELLKHLTSLQQPALFDFVRGRDQTVWASGRPP